MIKEYWKRAVRVTAMNVLFFLIPEIPISRFLCSAGEHVIGEHLSGTLYSE